MKFSNRIVQILFLTMMFVFNYGIIGFSHIRDKYSKGDRKIFWLHQVYTFIITLIGILSAYYSYRNVWKDSWIVILNDTFGLLAFLGILLILFIFSLWIDAISGNYLRPELKENEMFCKLYLIKTSIRYFVFALMSLIIGFYIGGPIIRAMDDLLSNKIGTF